MRLTILALGLLLGCSHAPKTMAPNPPDENLWLEDVRGDKPLAWAKEQSAQTLKALESLPAYRQNEADIRRILLAEDRLAPISQMGQYFYNFWQDGVRVRGIWRRTTLAEYRRAKPKWDVVLDLDKLAKQEKENWVFKGAQCLPPQYELCLIRLSRGGGDAVVAREFDATKKAFVKDGFIVPEAKNQLAWVDQNTLIVGTNFGPDSLTDSGYPRMAKLWKRGTPLAQAKLLLEGAKSDVSVWPSVIHTTSGVKMMVGRGVSFYEDEVYEVKPDFTLKKIAKPLDAQYSAWLNGQDILWLRSDWTVRGETFKAGSVVALAPVESAQPKVVFAPNARQSVAVVGQTKDALIINYLDTVQGKIARAWIKDDQWKVEDLPFPEKGQISLTSLDSLSNLVMVIFENFLVPSSILMADTGLVKKAAEIRPETLKSLPARFDASRFQVQQLWTKSKDGTEVPYFLISDKNLKLDGQTPTLIYGYGGFEISQEPYYPSVTGKVWLEKGGAYVVANIRGGGEFGPRWHQAALKENRQRAFDDFIAVAEDLVARKVSSPAKMAISGGSNGGLLVGATFVQRPDLYGAVICKVPLLDMLRYNQLLAGASWVGEYGDPNDPVVRPALIKYSPYQNVKPGVKYPEVFFLTSTMDDRVHPGHARKMVARMRAQGHPLLYFENTEGGHSAAANLLQRVRSSTLEYTFLQDRLLKKQ